ncbi:MAG: putative cell wall binding protein [Clostridium sp. Maddingley MBC34-26]|nr:MAG: putative cell wall binding protein [Clostridium sp. Maddingley MBC34-26]
MKKTFLRKILSAIIVPVMITILMPLGVSAQWRENTDKSWSYIDGTSLAKDWRYISGVWYYFNSDGKMKTGWTYDKGNWYF